MADYEQRSLALLESIDRNLERMAFANLRPLLAAILEAGRTASGNAHGGFTCTSLEEAQELIEKSDEDELR